MPQMGSQTGREQAAILTLLQKPEDDILGRITVEGNPACRCVPELRENLRVEPVTQFAQLNQDGVATGIFRHHTLLPGHRDPKR